MNDGTDLCITHYIDGVSACFVRDIHYADCPRENCNGCVAREAKEGYVCAPCFSRLERAISEWELFSIAFAGVVRAVQPEPGGGTSKPSSTVPLSPLQLTMESIGRYGNVSNARLAELGGRAADWIDRLVAPAPTTAIADRDAFILREFVREGVCLSCGGAVLNSGEHVEEDRHADRDARILEDAAEEWGIAYKGASGPVDRMSEAHARNHLVEWPEDTLMARKVFPWIAVSRRREASPQEGGVE